MTMFSLTEDANGRSLAIFYGDGDSETIPETHVAFQKIIDKLVSGKATDEEIRELTRVLETVTRKMSALSERVSVDGKQVYFDGDPLSGELTSVIKSMFEQGRSLDFKPLVSFLEKSKTNPSLKSIDDLYRWIKKGDLVIDHEGDIIAYKGVKVGDDGIARSIHSGTAFVNGEEVHGYIPNVPGTVISMARSTVNADEMVGCATGLHAGTYNYANSFAQGRLILVKINPRDVVSVPYDAADQKMRVSRYTVLHEIEQRITGSFYQSELPYDEDEEDEDDWYEEDAFEDWEDEDEEDYEDEEEDQEESVEETPEASGPITIEVTTPQPSQSAKDFFTSILNRTYPKAQEPVEEVPEEPKVERDYYGRRIG